MSALSEPDLDAIADPRIAATRVAIDELAVPDPTRPSRFTTVGSSASVSAVDIAAEILGPKNGLAIAATAETVRRFEARHITGDLDLSKCQLQVHLEFVHCVFDGTVNLKDASLLGLRFEDCSIANGLKAPGIHVEYRVNVTRSWVGRRTDFSGGRIGRLELDHTTFGTKLPVAPPRDGNGSGDDENDEAFIPAALDLAILRVERSIQAKSIAVFGRCQLVGTQIGGQLDLSDSHFFTSPDRAALALREMQVTRRVLARDLRVRGRVSATGAQIGGAFDLRSIQVVACGRDATEFAVDLLHVVTKRWTVFNQSVILGGLRLAAAEIAGNARLQGVVISAQEHGAEDPISVDAAGLSVGRTLELCAGEVSCACTGQVRLANAKVGADLTIRNATLSGQTAFDATGASVTGTFTWQSIACAADAKVLLPDLSVRRWRIDRGLSASDRRTLTLSGISFSVIDCGTDASADLITQTLARQCQTDIGPYQTAAAALRAHGRDEDARRVMLKGEWNRVKNGGLPWTSNWWGRLVGWTTGFGTQLFRVPLILAIAILVSAGIFHLDRAEFRQTRKPDPAAIVVDGHGHRVSDPQPSFSGLEYAVAATLPDVAVGNSDAWTPVGVARWIAIALRCLFWLLAGALGAALARLSAARSG